MKKHDIRKCLVLLKHVTLPILTSLHLNKHSQGLYYYQFGVNGRAEIRQMC